MQPGDGEFDTSDLVLALASGYSAESRPRVRRFAGDRSVEVRLPWDGHDCDLVAIDKLLAALGNADIWPATWGL
jgi:hypothetical protein